MDKLAAVSGKAAPKRALLKQLLHSDFDPDAWDDHMGAAFGDDYYAAAEREDDVRADAADLARDLASWAPEGGPGDDVARDGTFAALHSRVTGSAAVELPETDYDIAAPAREDAADAAGSDVDGDTDSADAGSSSDPDSDDSDAGGSSSGANGSGTESEPGGDNEGATTAEKQRTKEQVCGLIRLHLDDSCSASEGQPGTTSSLALGL